MYDINQARTFIASLTGSASSVVTFQTFYDPKKPYPRRPELAKIWASNLDLSLEFIEYCQANHCGIHICINGMDGTERNSENVTDLRALVVDFDGSLEPEWTLAPHIVQKRDDTHGHAIWLLDGENQDAETWSIVQKRMSIHYGSDGQLISPNHTIRLPGFGHFKDPENPAQYSITVNNVATLPKYAMGDVMTKHVLNEQEQDTFDKWVMNREGIHDGLGYERNDYEERKFVEFISFAAYPAVEGSGTHELIRVSSFGHDHGIPLEVAQELLWEHYNPRCEPPWQDYERSHFYEVCYRAYTMASSAPGCKTVKAEFGRLELEEPACGWDNQKAEFGPTKPEPIAVTVEDVKKSITGEFRLDELEAELLICQMNSTSAHYDFARVFDGINYNGQGLIRFNKQFYVYTGRSWKAVGDELIKSQVQKMLAPHKPSNTFTSGVLMCLCDLVTTIQIENGQWIGDSDIDTKNLAVFKNGMVDLGAEKPVLMDHTYEFFNLNELPYNYVENATCPKWCEFLTSIWGDNQDLKDQLQQWMGYCLTRDTSLQKYAIFVGKPRGGKGTITDMISNIIGTVNTSSPALSDLVKDSAKDMMSTSAIALIPDAHNVNINVRDSVLSTLKAIVGQDPITFHRMYKGAVSTIFSTKIMMSSNNLPDFNDPSGALADRMLIFPFITSFVGKENIHLRRQLSAEVEGVLQWAITGLKMLRQQGKFTEAKEGVAEKQEIKEDMFPLSQYVKELCTLDGNEFTFIEDLYNAYRIWAISTGVRSPMLPVAFKKCLRNSSLPIHHEQRGKSMGFHGITVSATVRNNVIGFPPVKVN